MDSKTGRTEATMDGGGSARWYVFTKAARSSQGCWETLGQTRFRGWRCKRERCCWRLTQSTGDSEEIGAPNAADRHNAIALNPRFRIWRVRLFTYSIISKKDE